MLRESLIVGADEAAHRRRPEAEVTTGRLLAESARLALEDARMTPSDINGLGVTSFSLVPDRAIDVAFRLGLRVSWLMDGGTGGASAVEMLQHAPGMWRIASEPRRTRTRPTATRSSYASSTRMGRKATASPQGSARAWWLRVRGFARRRPPAM